ncbi:N-acetylmuramoyl-L-alanine amidase [Streptomyces sp. DSM 44917]|uniref:N-acetylmuramoyl-L-alanine amidase n=1 Tax=Streptomyces boetiae TaxID=3075541 RepID=A0ABU2L3J4_9ACTN|nr:N-acetylmuramoyl-L-alanine amidase [Streptomyces sp. DSM 44917]MDT0306136.1 N-acetylmuramoyl-L-alanine amidase [Streptomyces sp. DSM 44917]
MTAWYPGASRMTLQPEASQQPAIRPTQMIVHSIVAPWTPRRLYEYWRDSTSLESHFGLGYDGSLGQYLPVTTRADANASANRRPDGTGAVSVETASNTSASDPWTEQQVEALIRLGVWLHQVHGIPLRICRTPDDPGYGWHRLHAAWSTGGTACPGAARVTQFREVVFPGIAARATGQTTTPGRAPEEDDMALSDEDVARIAAAVWRTDGILRSPSTAAEGNTHWTADSYLRNLHSLVRGLPEAAARQVALYKDTRLDPRDARQMWDDAASPHHTWQFRPDGSERDAWGLLTATAAEVAALRSVVATLAAGGGLDAAEIQAAAEAGARAFASELGRELTDGRG